MTTAFEDKVSLTAQRFRDLAARLAAAPSGQAGTADALLAELSDAMEELQVSGEEISHQNSELAAARQALEVERQRYQDLFDLAPDGYMVTDIHAVIREANLAAGAMLRYAPEKLTGKPLAVFVPEEDRPSFRKHLLLLATGNADGRGEWELLLQPREGEPVPVAVSVVPFRGRIGNSLGLRWLLRDVSERKRTEEKLSAYRVALERLVAERTSERDLVFNTGAEGMLMVARDFTILRANRVAIDMLGRRDGEVIGRNCGEALGSEHCGTAGCPVARILAGESRVETEAALLRPDGGRLHCLLTATPLRDSSGNLVGAIESIKDITEYRLMQMELLQSQKMEAIGRLAGGVAHDFNNLMAVVTGYADRLLRNGAVDDSSRKAIATIRTAGERAIQLTRHLLAFGRKQVLQPRVLDLNLLVRETGEMLQRVLGDNIDVTYKLDPALGRIRADSAQIHQVIMNLAVNARDAMPNGGCLDMNTANVDLPPSGKAYHLAPPGPYIQLTVRDTGCGMDEETQAHIFEPFFTTKPPGSAGGLGLSTVYGIVRQSGGDIRVYTAPGQGTTFVVYLPRVQEPLSPDEPPQQSGPQIAGGSETILLVEDERSLREIIKLELEDLGYHVIDAGNVGEALTAFAHREGTIALVLSDVVLPGMSGPRLVKILAERRPQIKALYMSGHTGTYVVRQGALEPGIALMEKPFTADTLARKVREILDAPAPAPAGK